MGASATRSSATARGCATTPTFSDAEEDEISADVKRLLNEAIRLADESPLPDVSTLTEGVYATPEELDTPHHK